MDDSAPAPMMDDALTRELLAFFREEIEPRCGRRRWRN